MNRFYSKIQNEIFSFKSSCEVQKKNRNMKNISKIFVLKLNKTIIDFFLSKLFDKNIFFVLFNEKLNMFNASVNLLIECSIFYIRRKGNII